MRTGYEPTIKLDERTGYEPCLGGVHAVAQPAGIYLFIDSELVNCWNLSGEALLPYPDVTECRIARNGGVHVDISFMSDNDLELKECIVVLSKSDGLVTNVMAGSGSIYDVVYVDWFEYPVYKLRFSARAIRIANDVR